MKNIRIYTDGACDFNTRGANNIGGYAFVAIDDNDDKLFEGYGRMKNTTNNRMEIIAVVEALKKVDPEWTVKVYSDSTYVVNTVMKGWKKKKNTDLWDQLTPLVSSNVELEWVRGHSTNIWNNYCDRLATKKVNLPEIPLDISEALISESLETLFA